MRLVLLCLTLAACAGPKLNARTGPPVHVNAPQAAEQCRAQPALDWCVHAGR